MSAGDINEIQMYHVNVTALLITVQAKVFAKTNKGDK